MEIKSHGYQMCQEISSTYNLGYIHGWGTQKDYFAPKSLLKHYFE